MSPRRINQLTAVLLLAGIVAAAVLYVTARPPEVDPFGQPLNSKKYRHELQLMGGKANVAFAEFEAWLASLWEGRARAGTLLVITVVTTLLFRFVAAHPELFLPEPPTPPKPDPDKPAPPR